VRLLEDYIALEQAVGMPMLQKAPTPSRGNEKRIAEIANQFRLGLGDGPIHNLFEAVEEIIKSCATVSRFQGFLVECL